MRCHIFRTSTSKQETKNPFNIRHTHTRTNEGTMIRGDDEEISAGTRQFARNRGNILRASLRSGTEFLDSRVPQITGRYVADSGREADGQNNDDRQG